MASDDEITAERDEAMFSNPWPALCVGLGATALAFLLKELGGTVAQDTIVLVALRLVLLAIGLLAASIAATISPRPGVLLGALVSCLLAKIGMNPAWDTASLVLGVLAGIAAAAALVMLLPRTARRVVFSLFLLFHFGGILTAINNIPPPNSYPNWLVSHLWSRVYRPYLQFMYLNNAYHFYSPEPGPATLLWFRVEFADGATRRLHIIDRDLYTLSLQYQRRLSLTESINQMNMPSNVLPPAIQKAQRDRLARSNFEIPMQPEMVPTLQYREPSTISKRLMESYTRYVARTTEHPAGKAEAVTGVKVYRVIHRILDAREFSEGLDPLDPTTYLAYYEGEFEPDGKMKNSCFLADWNKNGDYEVLYQDPYLHWVIPILREPPADEQNKPRAGNAELSPEQLKKMRTWPVKNYVKIHAGDKDEGGDVW